MCVGVDRERAGKSAMPHAQRLDQRAKLHSRRGELRAWRCREKESFGAEYCETDETRVSGASAIAKAMRVEANAGICSAWQT